MEQLKKEKKPLEVTKETEEGISLLLFLSKMRPYFLLFLFVLLWSFFSILLIGAGTAITYIYMREGEKNLHNLHHLGGRRFSAMARDPQIAFSDIIVECGETRERPIVKSGNTFYFYCDSMDYIFSLLPSPFVIPFFIITSIILLLLSCIILLSGHCAIKSHRAEIEERWRI